MAVVTEICFKQVYQNPAVAGSPSPEYARGGNETKTIKGLATIASGDADGSVFILGAVPAMAVLDDIRLTNTAITAGTDYQLGLYKRTGPATFEVIDANVLMAATSMATARLEGSGVSGLSAVAVGDRLKRVYELAGHTITQRLNEYYIGLLAATIGSADGSVGFDARYLNSVQ